MFVSNDIPNNFNKVAEISDNYIVLVRENKLVNNTNYQAYYQFFSPSTEIIYTDHYRITTGDTYTYDYNYNTNQYYSYIDSMDLNFSKETFFLDNISTDLFDRHDYWSIGLTVALFLCLTILICNLATSLVHRGGIFK